MPHLIDLRFADVILFFARSAMEVGKLLDSLVDELPVVKLVLHVLIEQLTVNRLRQSRLIMESCFAKQRCAKLVGLHVNWIWVGTQISGLQFHLQQAAKAYQATRV